MLFSVLLSPSSNMEDLEYMKRDLNPNGKAELKMLSDFIPGSRGKEVPDAYYARGIFHHPLSL